MALSHWLQWFQWWFSPQLWSLLSELWSLSSQPRSELSSLFEEMLSTLRRKNFLTSLQKPHNRLPIHSHPQNLLTSNLTQYKVIDDDCDDNDENMVLQCYPGVGVLMPGGCNVVREWSVSWKRLWAFGGSVSIKSRPLSLPSQNSSQTSWGISRLSSAPLDISALDSSFRWGMGGVKWLSADRGLLCICSKWFAAMGAVPGIHEARFIPEEISRIVRHARNEGGMRRKSSASTKLTQNIGKERRLALLHIALGKAALTKWKYLYARKIKRGTMKDNYRFITPRCRIPPVHQRNQFRNI